MLCEVIQRDQICILLLIINLRLCFFYSAPRHEISTNFNQVMLKVLLKVT